jgi:hypothetical protein
MREIPEPMQPIDLYSILSVETSDSGEENYQLVNSFPFKQLARSGGPIANAISAVGHPVRDREFWEILFHEAAPIHSQLCAGFRFVDEMPDRYP